MNKPAYFRFQLFFWRHRLLLLGPAFDTACHAHHAAQLCIGLTAPVGVRSGEGDWQQASGFYIPPGVAHQFDGTATSCIMLYLDSESTDCQRACQQWGRQGVRMLEDLPDIPESWKKCMLGDVEFPELLAEQLVVHLLKPGSVAMECVAESGGQELFEPGDAGLKNTNEVRQVDPRLRLILDWLDNHLTETIRLAEVAAAAGVSESWLSHQFSRTFGLPLRRYVLWRRLRKATESALAGYSLTEAAHRAGFSDSAHLTRSFRESFGVTPSFLVRNTEQLRVVFIDK